MEGVEFLLRGVSETREGARDSRLFLVGEGPSSSKGGDKRDEDGVRGTTDECRGVALIVGRVDEDQAAWLVDICSKAIVAPIDT